MKNLISERVADFLKNYPPFNELHQNDLSSLSEEIIIIYKEKGEAIFLVDEEPHSIFYVVNKGAVALRRNDSTEIIDICDEGDIFGLRPLMANENYKLQATAYEESILYAISIEAFKPFALAYEEIGNFLIESFASNTRNPYSKNHRGKLFGDPSNIENKEDTIKSLDLQLVRYSKKIVNCKEDTPINKVALSMTSQKVGFMVVTRDGLPIGIITDKDLRNKVATGLHPISAPASSIMSSPIITYPANLTVTQAQMAMIKNKIGHLCLTEDGTAHTRALGILSKHDIMLSLGNNPAVLIKAIERARKFKQLKSIRQSIQQLLKGYLDQNLPMGLVSKIISELNDACLKKIIQISLVKMRRDPPVKFAWLSLGSQGRSEQLLLTDQDSALVFEDVSEESLPSTTDYFLQLGSYVTKGLFTMGFEYCPAEMMASNPKWCLSLSEWKNVISHWIINPGPDEVLMSSIFFDFNFSYGEVSLVDQISEHMHKTAGKYPIFYMHLASGALQNPSPTGFFRQFLVEEDGAHKDYFDVKRRALMPLIDGARVLAFSHQIKAINNTSDRFEKLAQLEPNNEEIFMACSYATKALLKFRTKQGLLHNDSGRFIALDKLTKEEKLKLKRTFTTIKELQELIRIRFKVTNLLG